MPKQTRVVLGDVEKSDGPGIRQRISPRLQAGVQVGVQFVFWARRSTPCGILCHFGSAPRSANVTFGCLALVDNHGVASFYTSIKKRAGNKLKPKGREAHCA